MNSGSAFIKIREKIKCSKVGIWVAQLLLEDGLQQLWNAIKEVAIAKGVFTQTFLANLHKNAK